MAASERLVILVSRQQKEELANLAAEADMSVGEYVRQRALNDERLGQLVDEVNAAAAAAEKALARLDVQTVDLEAAEAAARQRALDEFSDLSPERFAKLTQPVEQVG